MIGLSLKEGGRHLGGMFFRRGSAVEFIKPGSSFRRIHPDRLEETAKVLSVGPDASGITHVWFQIDFKRPFVDSFTDGQRVLALKSFASLYTERVAA